MSNITKACIVCNRELPNTEEYFERKPSGLRNQCRACRLAYMKQYREANAQKMFELQFKWRASQRGNKERFAEYRRKARQKRMEQLSGGTK